MMFRLLTLICAFLTWMGASWGQDRGSAEDEGLSSVPSMPADTGLVDDGQGLSESDDLEEGGTVADRARRAKKRRKTRNQKAKKDEQNTNLIVEYQSEGLALLALGLLFFFTRSRDQRLSATKRPERKSPVSGEELGRALYGVISSERFSDYRALYINGGEAAQVLGEEAARAYLERRSPEVLKNNLARHVQAFRGSTGYAGFEHSADDRFSIQIKLGNQKERLVPIGSVVMLGAVYRLVVPDNQFESK